MTFGGMAAIIALLNGRAEAARRPRGGHLQPERTGAARWSRPSSACRRRSSSGRRTADVAGHARRARPPGRRSSSLRPARSRRPLARASQPRASPNEVSVYRLAGSGDQRRTLPRRGGRLRRDRESAALGLERRGTRSARPGARAACRADSPTAAEHPATRPQRAPSSGSGRPCTGRRPERRCRRPARR